MENAAGSSGRHSISRLLPQALQSTETLPAYDVSCRSGQDSVFSLQHAKPMSRTLSVVNVDTKQTVLERKFKGRLSSSAQILKDGSAKWSYTPGSDNRTITLSRLSGVPGSNDVNPPTYDDIDGVQKIQMESVNFQPLIFNLKYGDVTGTQWHLRWMRREDYDSKDYKFSATQWKEIVCVDISNLRILATIQRKTKHLRTSFLLTISNTVLPDFQEFLLATAVAVYDSFPSSVSRTPDLSQMTDPSHTLAMSALMGDMY